MLLGTWRSIIGWRRLGVDMMFFFNFSYLSSLQLLLEFTLLSNVFERLCLEFCELVNDFLFLNANISSSLLLCPNEFFCIKLNGTFSSFKSFVLTLIIFLFNLCV